MYTVWGNEKNTSDSDWAKENPIRYNGQYLDNETGFYYLRARYYDPSIHRFTSEDPHWDIENMIFGDDENAVNPDNSAILQANNLYSYCINDPINYQDSNGERSGEIDGKILKTAAEISEILDNFMPIKDFGMFLYSTKVDTDSLYATIGIHAYNVYHFDKHRGFVNILGNGASNDEIKKYAYGLMNAHNLLEIQGVDTNKSYKKLTETEKKEIVEILWSADVWFTKKLIQEYRVKRVKEGVEVVYGV